MIARRVCRWTAVALAAAAIVDPRVPFPHRERPPVRLVTGQDQAARARLNDRLRTAGFAIAAEGESAAVVDASARITPWPSSAPIYGVREHVGGPDVSIARASASGMRVAGQPIAVSVIVRAHGARGATTTLRLEDGGLVVASAAHRWSADEERWHTTLSYLPERGGALRLRVRADLLPGERCASDNVADLLAPAVRGPIRVLVLESGVTWPAVFVRRALEAAPGFAVSAIQHATKPVATRAGSPPRGLSHGDLSPYEVVVIGQPESLNGEALNAVRWFVEQRGGVAVLVPDRPLPARYADLAGSATLEAKTLDAPVALGGSGDGLMAGDLAIPRTLPPLAFTLASDPAGAPVVFGLRRGMGAVIVSGALDAWRYRDRHDSVFARFWPAAILQQAAAVPPLVEVTAIPSLARPGDLVRVTARLRGTELAAGTERVVVPAASAAALNPAARSETGVRLWPAPEPGTYEGEWRPGAAGDYAVEASIGESSGATIVKVAADAAVPAGDDDGLAIAAGATGGGVFDDEPALVRALSDALPARTVMRPFKPARSPWYAAAFTLLLCGEWALRRRRGLP